eukprot:3884421-Pleurochrysis_carterae.AAC.1
MQFLVPFALSCPLVGNKQGCTISSLSRSRTWCSTTSSELIDEATSCEEDRQAAFCGSDALRGRARRGKGPQ